MAAQAEDASPGRQCCRYRRSGRQSLFYGWYIAVACGVVAYIAWGVGFYQLGVFLHAFHERFGWSVTALSGADMLFYFLTGATSVVIGKALDWQSSRRVIIIGGCAIAVATIGLGQARALWQVYAFDAVLAVGYGCTQSLVLGVLITRWFARRQALAMTVALLGAPLGGLTLVPLNTMLIARYGLAMSSLILAMIAICLIMPAAIFVVRDKPTDEEAQIDRSNSPTAGVTNPLVPIWTMRTSLCTSLWWRLTLAFTVMLLGQVAYLVHQVNFLSAIVGSSEAAKIVSLTLFFALLGRPIGAGLGDRLPKRLVAAFCFAVQGLSVLVSVHTSSKPLLLISTAAFGMTIGNTIMLQPLLMTDAFGPRSYGAVNGPAYLITYGGSAVGLLVVGALADRSGSYTLPFTLTAILTLGGAALLLRRTTL